MLPPLIVIGGATATGKTRLSLDIAEALGAEIVSADSRQVYRGMDIGTAKVSGTDRARVPHHGLDLVDPDVRFTAADFRRYALAILADIAARGRPAVLVGGTGLYLRAVARGVPMDTTGEDPVVRAELEDRLERDGLPSLLAELQSLAPNAWERVDRANHRRVIRAIERARVEGDAPPPPPEGYPAPVVWLGMAADPDRHAQDIEDRARAQFRDGLLDEAAELRARFGEDQRPFGAMGYREAFSCPVRRDHPRTGHPAHRGAHPQLRQPATHMVPGGTGHPLALARAGGGGRRPRDRQRITRPGHAPGARMILDGTRVDAWRLARQHLLDADATDLEGVATDLVGIQAQVLSAAELSLNIRVAGTTPETVRDAVADRRLVRMWAMRGTLHLVPAALVPTVAAALRTKQLWRRPVWLRYYGVSTDDMERLIAAVTDALADGQPRTRAELARDVAPELGSTLAERLRSSWGELLKPVAAEGLLCQGPASGGSVTFVRPDRWVTDWRQEDPIESRDRLWLDYLAAYGPATVDEMARWWGMPAANGKRIHAGLASRVVQVSVDGTPAWVRAEDLDALATTEPTRGHVRLLGAFDPFTVGAGLRTRLIPAEHRALVSRTAGWISPVILVDGRVAGVWSSTTAKGSQRFVMQPFPGTAVPWAAVERQAAAIAALAGLEAQLEEGVAHPGGGA